VIGLRALGVAGALLVVLPAIALRAQTSAQLPARPHLALGADTNSGQANYEYGLKVVSSDPDEAARAFYWASRIDPSSGDALYALRAAKVLAMNADEFTAYMEWRGDKRTPQQLALDSLVYRSYVIDPFTFGNIDAAIMRRSIEASIRKSNPKIDAGSLAYAVAVEMQEFGNRAWFAYTQGKFDDALRMYAEQLKAKPMPLTKKKDAERAWQAYYDAKIQIHAQRGLIFYMIDSLDSARAEMSTAIEGDVPPGAGDDSRAGASPGARARCVRCRAAGRPVVLRRARTHRRTSARAGRHHWRAFGDGSRGAAPTR